MLIVVVFVVIARKRHPDEARERDIRDADHPFEPSWRVMVIEKLSAHGRKREHSNDDDRRHYGLML